VTPWRATSKEIGSAGRRIDVRNDEILIGRFRGDDGAKEVVVVFAIQQGGEVSGAILAKNGKGETRRGGAAGTGRRNREDALGRLVIAGSTNRPRSAEKGVSMPVP